MVSWAFSANFPSCGAPYFCPFRLSFHSQQLCPPCVHAPNPTFGAKPPSKTGDSCSGWDAQSRCANHVRSSYFVLPCTDHPLHSPLIPRSFLSVPDDFLTVREFFWVCGPTLPLASHQCCCSLFWFLSSFFLSFFLPDCEDIFLALLGVQSPSLLFSRCSERTVLFVDVFFF